MNVKNNFTIFAAVCASIIVSFVVSISVVNKYKPTFAQCGSLNREVMSAGTPISASIKSGIPEENSNNLGWKMLDKNPETFAYPNNSNLDYLIEFTNLYHLRFIMIDWGEYGSNDIFINNWSIDGCNQDGQWVRLQNGKFPGEEVSAFAINMPISQLRIQADSKNWIGIYEVSFE